MQERIAAAAAHRQVRALNMEAGLKPSKRAKKEARAAAKKRAKGARQIFILCLFVHLDPPNGLSYTLVVRPQHERQDSFAGLGPLTGVLDKRS